MMLLYAHFVIAGNIDLFVTPRYNVGKNLELYPNTPKIHKRHGKPFTDDYV